MIYGKVIGIIFEKKNSEAAAKGRNEA